MKHALSKSGSRPARGSHGPAADLIVTRAEVRTGDPAQVRDVSVDTTIVGGKVVYQKD